MAVTSDPEALDLRITGIVQGVGFRPFVYRLASRHALRGWVCNDAAGVLIHVEGEHSPLERFVADLRAGPPPAARIADVERRVGRFEGSPGFTIRESPTAGAPSTRISPDLPVCDACIRELFDPADRRYRYPYVNCTDCGPRYSIVHALPYDRARTTMAGWPMCADCRREYDDPLDRRFHAQPLACPRCGPQYVLEAAGGRRRGDDALRAAAHALRAGRIVAVKGIGGYHLACDAYDAAAVAALRERKYRKERAFAVLVRDVAAARELGVVGAAAETLLRGPARPIVLVPARRTLDGVAPDNLELGLMLPSTPLHHLLFADGAPDALVMTSANRSSEPMAYEDADALAALADIADAFLIGERPIARRIDDAVVRAGASGPTVLRRARGLAPGAVASLPSTRPILALGADLKNSITLVVRGQAFMSQHVGDLADFGVRRAFADTIHDLCAMYELEPAEATIVHDLHPQYVSTEVANELGERRFTVQHHRAHVASVLAEAGAWQRPVLGLAFDGTGYGDDGSIWGGEAFVGSVAGGFARVAHLRPASLAGGDAAARFPVQAAAGFLHELVAAGTLRAPPFGFPERYERATELIARDVRCFVTTSVGRLFDTVAALLGFVREQTFEGQAAIWLEHTARRSPAVAAYPFPFDGRELDYRPLLTAVVADRIGGRAPAEIARAFHGAVVDAMLAIAEYCALEQVVASGGVLQNALLASLLVDALGERLLLNAVVPPNDGGLSLGQAALAAHGVAV